MKVTAALIESSYGRFSFSHRALIDVAIRSRKASCDEGWKSACEISSGYRDEEARDSGCEKA